MCKGLPKWIEILRSPATVNRWITSLLVFCVLALVWHVLVEILLAFAMAVSNAYWLGIFTSWRLPLDEGWQMPLWQFPRSLAFSASTAAKVFAAAVMTSALLRLTKYLLPIFCVLVVLVPAAWVMTSRRLLQGKAVADVDLFRLFLSVSVIGAAYVGTALGLKQGSQSFRWLTSRARRHR